MDAIQLSLASSFSFDLLNNDTSYSDYQILHLRTWSQMGLPNPKDTGLGGCQVFDI